MGLDMYVYRCKKRGDPKLIPMVDFPSPEFAEEIVHWCKHPNLHGWMEKLYRRKGGIGNFNCENLELELKDIRKLEKAIINKKLPVTTGLFFGESKETQEEMYKDLFFIKIAKKVIKEGYSIYYNSSW